MAQEVGKVVHYYDKLGVAIVELSAPLSVGDTVTFTRGDDTFEQALASMQVEHQDVQRAKAGDSVGVKVDHKVREGTIVSKAA